ncbi:MAG: site-specific DNA-methyltransferase [Patescibacteria group bacterium]|nr:site-specific DNA-methyltransferase [Patescibacteria group bacterium]
MKPLGKDNAAYVFTASQPFTSKLVMSNLKWFKYEWMWEKQKASNFMSLKYQPAKYHENILVFSRNKHIYNPIKWLVAKHKIDKRKTINNSYQKKETHLGIGLRIRNKDDGTRYPKSIIKINKSINKNFHPTQKPVALFEYLIKTYTNEGDLVLDPFAGSFTTAVACKKLNRKFIGIEMLEKYCEVGVERLKAIQPSLINN